MKLILPFLILFSLNSFAEVIDIFSFTKETNTGYRIPALITSKKGTLLAFCERRKGLHDHAENDIVLRRSFDHGKTWQDLQVIHDDGGNSLNDPCALTLKSGRILLIYQRFPKGVHARNSGHTVMAENGYDGPKNTRTYLTFSDDDGASWSVPEDISRQARRKDRISIGSPGQGIQLTRGKYKGRVIFPLYETRRIDAKNRDWSSSCLYSDDNGKTWQLSNILPHPEGVKGHANEAQIVETSEGVLFNARNQGGLAYRKVSRSIDGGKSWSKITLDKQLPGVRCMGSILRYSWAGENSQSIIIYAGPASQKSRKEGTLRLSYDEGQNWTKKLLLKAPYFGYSCMTKTSDGKIGLLYETEGCRKISFTTISLEQFSE